MSSFTSNPECRREVRAGAAHGMEQPRNLGRARGARRPPVTEGTRAGAEESRKVSRKFPGRQILVKFYQDFSDLPNFQFIGVASRVSLMRFRASRADMSG